jgi:hypothetical protein
MIDQLAIDAWCLVCLIFISAGFFADLFFVRPQRTGRSAFKILHLFQFHSLFIRGSANHDFPIPSLTPPVLCASHEIEVGVITIHVFFIYLNERGKDETYGKI